MPLPTTSSAGDSVRCLDLDDFDLRFDRYRLIQPKADLLMARSLSKYGQLAPVVYCQLEGSLVLVDGFKRLRAARTLKGVTSLKRDRLKSTSKAPKRLSSISIESPPSPMNWKNRGSSMPWCTTMACRKSKWLKCLGRHKSWVNRRLALIERLTDEAREALRLGTALTDASSPSNSVAARQPKRSHAVCHRACTHFARTLRNSQALAIRQHSRANAIRLRKTSRGHPSSLKTAMSISGIRGLSTAGNRAAKRLGLLLDAATKMNHWLRSDWSQ